MHHSLIKQLFYDIDSQSVFEDRFDSVLFSALSSDDSCTSDDCCTLDSWVILFNKALWRDKVCFGLLCEKTDYQISEPVILNKLKLMLS